MTEIDFCFNVADKFRLVSRYALKSIRQNNKLFILAPDDHQASEVRHALWSFEQTSFIPHCSSASPLAAETPIIVDTMTEAPPHHDILLNLCADYPPSFSRFSRLIDIVGNDEEDKVAGRTRYRFYRDRGYVIRQHDLSGQP